MWCELMGPDELPVPDRAESANCFARPAQRQGSVSQRRPSQQLHQFETASTQVQESFEAPLHSNQKQESFNQSGDAEIYFNLDTNS